MSGKTGTSQVRSMTSKELFSKCENMEYKNRHHGIFVGYAPSNDPKIAVASVVEHGCHGSTAAAPVVRDVITKYMQKYESETYETFAKEDKIKFKKYWQKKAREKKEKEKLEAIKKLEEPEEGDNTQIEIIERQG